jgi:putative transposase
VAQQARDLAMELGERMDSLRFLIRDRDTKFTTAFDEVFRTGGVGIIKTPPQAPRANSICERLVGALRREIFDQMLIFNEKHRSAILTEYTGHYNDHRPHQSRDQRPPMVETTHLRPITDLADVRSIRRQPILGGLINQYHRARLNTQVNDPNPIFERDRVESLASCGPMSGLALWM